MYHSIVPESTLTHTLMSTLPIRKMTLTLLFKGPTNQRWVIHDPFRDQQHHKEVIWRRRITETFYTIQQILSVNGPGPFTGWKLRSRAKMNRRSFLGRNEGRKQRLSRFSTIFGLDSYSFHGTNGSSPRVGVGHPNYTINQSTLLRFQQTMDNNTGSNTNLMLSDSGDKRLADAEEQLLLQVIQLFRLDRNSSRLFKLHKKRVNWTEHVNALIHSKEFTKTYHMPYSAFVFLVDILWEDVFVDQALSIIATKSAAKPTQLCNQPAGWGTAQQCAGLGWLTKWCGPS